MQTQYGTCAEEVQDLLYGAEEVAQGLGQDLARFLYPLLVRLDEVLDKRLVRTFLQAIAVIISFRDRMHGLWLSEMGGHLLDAEHERAGIHNQDLGYVLLHSMYAGKTGSLSR